jgi:hypothetical protein
MFILNSLSPYSPCSHIRDINVFEAEGLAEMENRDKRVSAKETTEKLAEKEGRPRKKREHSLPKNKVLERLFMFRLMIGLSKSR